MQAPRRADDRRLAERAASGDAGAFEAIFERHHRGLLSLCRHLLGSREEAEDALQHTFAVAYRELVESGPPNHLRAWLYATARNRSLDVLRRRRELPAGLPAAATAGLPEEVERRSDLRDLVDDLGRLPEEQRAALVLSELGDMEHAEVAEVLGCRRDKVRALVFQARSSLAGWREARALPCRGVREEIAVARGGGLRRGHLRRHLKVCPDCAAFREDVDRQRRNVALLLPVVPTLGLKARVLEAAWGAAGGAGAAAGGGAAAGTLGVTAVKIGGAALVLGVAGIATFGGLPGGSGPHGSGSPDRAPSAAPASVQQPAAGGDARPADGRPQPDRQQATKRFRLSERREPKSGAETVQPDAPAQPEPAPPQPQPAPQPEPPAPPPAPQPAPAPPAPESQGAPAENRSGAPQPELEVEAEVDPPDSLP